MAIYFSVATSGAQDTLPKKLQWVEILNKENKSKDLVAIWARTNLVLLVSLLFSHFEWISSKCKITVVTSMKRWSQHSLSFGEKPLLESRCLFCSTRLCKRLYWHFKIGWQRWINGDQVVNRVLESVTDWDLVK